MPWADAQAEHGMRSAGMCAQNTSDQVKRKGQTVFSQETLKLLSGNGISLFSSVLVQHAG